MKVDVKKQCRWNDKLDFGSNVSAALSEMKVSLIDRAEVNDGGKENVVSTGTFAIVGGQKSYDLSPTGKVTLKVEGR